MASVWHLLFGILPSLLVVASFKLPNLRFPFQDGHNEGNVEAGGLRVHSESPLGAPGRWEWKTGGDAQREFPQQPRRKRLATNHTYYETTTISTQTLHNNNTPGVIAGKISSDAPTTITPMTTGVIEANTREAATGTISVPSDKIHKEATTEAIMGSTPTTEDMFEADTTESDMTTGTILPQNSSIGGTGSATVAIKGKMEVTTGKGPLVGTETPRASPRTSVGTLAVSTGPPRQSTLAAGPYFRAKGTVRAVSTTASLAAAITSTKLAKQPEQKSPPIPNLVGKCLLAIFLLGLVAGIFIVITTVLATLLWRQKRAYKMDRHNHTEMVCISSLLAPEEMEEAGGRHPRVRRVRMLGDNTSEAEMDNLTLNSFLPDH